MNSKQFVAFASCAQQVQLGFMMRLSGIFQRILVALVAVQNALATPAPIYTFIDIADGEVGLINIETDQLIQVDVLSVPGWPYPGVADMMHSWITDDAFGNTVYVSTTAQPSSPGGAAVVGMKIGFIDWDAGDMDLSVVAFLELEPAGTSSEYPEVMEVVSAQPIPGWTMPPFTQIHGPTFRPDSPFSYGTTWTDSTVFAYNYNTNEELYRYSFPGFSDFSHGIFFNPSGSKALGANYFYDQTALTLYEFGDSDDPTPTVTGMIPLGTFNKRAAFMHYVSWLDNRFAVTATMQFARTSLTPADQDILPPSIWLIDSQEEAARRVVGTADNVDDDGVLLSASDIVVANGKLYVAEEDSIDGSFGEFGYVSIFDISGMVGDDDDDDDDDGDDDGDRGGGSPRNPRFVKRLRPSNEPGQLPLGFAVAHGLAVSFDEAFVFVAAYASNHVAKIDTTTDEVVMTWGASDGLNAPHGGFVAGRHR